MSKRVYLLLVLGVLVAVVVAMGVLLVQSPNGLLSDQMKKFIGVNVGLEVLKDPVENINTTPEEENAGIWEGQFAKPMTEFVPESR